MISAPETRGVRIWLAAMMALVLGMVALGGITRLTGSGLSMVTWEPILGAIPPRTEADWQHRFEQYRQSPEFQKINAEMTLPEFKWIFFWEYTHRLVGRAIGVVFLLPFLGFLARRRLSGRTIARLAVAFLLGGLQGGLGWFMVKSGLVDDPRVSHLRLAAHLSLALFLLGWLWWLFLDLAPPRRRLRGHALVRRSAWAFLLALIAQIVWGAFTAGLDAGLLHNTFPTMSGAWMPYGVFDFASGGVGDLINNPVTVQWLHRALGWAVGLGAFTLWLFARAYALTPRQRGALEAVFGLSLLQFGLGVATLLLRVPVALGVSHQVNAALLLLAVVTLVHATRAPPGEPR